MVDEPATLLDEPSTAPTELAELVDTELEDDAAAEGDPTMLDDGPSADGEATLVDEPANAPAEVEKDATVEEGPTTLDSPCADVVGAVAVEEATLPTLLDDTAAAPTETTLLEPADADADPYDDADAGPEDENTAEAELRLLLLDALVG